MKLALLAIAVLALGPMPPRGLLPHPSAYQMAGEACAVVEGVLQQDGSINVKARLFVGAEVEVADSLVVRGLSGMPRVVDPFGRAGNKQAIAPDSVLLFLDHRDADGTWSAYCHHGMAARGVIWFVGATSFGYAQCINPGPYVLGEWTGPGEGKPACMTPTAIGAEVVAAVAVRQQWRETLAIVDLDQRAKALAQWFSPSTSLYGSRWLERYRELQDACDVLGERMVPLLARVVQSDADPKAADFAASSIARMSTRGRATTPALIARLRDPRGASLQSLVSGLRALRDPRAQNVLHDCVLDDDMHLAALAARALAACGGDEAATLLAARMPGMIFASEQVAGLAAMLDALHDLDADRAEQLLRERFLAWEELGKRREWMRRVRAEGGR